MPNPNLEVNSTQDSQAGTQAQGEAQTGQQNQSTNPDLERLIQTTLAENERARINAENKVRELEDRLYTVTNQNTQTRQVNQNQVSNQESITGEQFLQNPLEVLRNEISRQVAPIIEYTQGMRVQNQYQSLKANYRQYPGFNVIEAAVDQFMVGKDPTHQNIQECIQRAVGHLMMTNPQALLAAQGGNNTNQNTNQNTNTNQQTNNTNQNQNTQNNNQQRVPDPQAHLRPTNGNVPTQQEHNNQNKRQLTENERRVCREMNITEDKYRELLGTGSQVNDWKEKAK